ncbi:hypothetical protein [Corynebacterium rhinophilum]|uniref:hypothetical protein n=1 Tax=Corynebacterium rhinophilum TaxID=3050197 RepID=UPI00254DC723|nr:MULTISPECIES: hypothetical protein [unclassified Corynebacterium]MDK8466943.1 hypothetical protein [Corynebacterium sp. MSK130]MDK8687569.1 hypothetical protein [Corynebacterium sp. MSK122]
MTNPTRQEIIDAQLARQWAEWNKSCEVSSPEIQAAANFILAHTTPPTMAEIEWDDDKHHLAEAEDEHGIRMIMVSDELDFIRCMQPPNVGGIVLGVPKKDLTPTGRRYVLQDEE